MHQWTHWRYRCRSFSMWNLKGSLGQRNGWEQINKTKTRVNSICILMIFKFESFYKKIAEDFFSHFSRCCDPSTQFRKWHHMLTTCLRHASWKLERRGHEISRGTSKRQTLDWHGCVQRSTAICAHAAHAWTIGYSLHSNTPLTRQWTAQTWAVPFHSIMPSVWRRRGNTEGGQPYHTWAMYRELLSLSFHTIRIIHTEIWD